MGTRFDLVIPDASRFEVNDIFYDVRQTVYDCEQMLSNYRQDSDVGRINENAIHNPVKVNTEVIQFLGECKKLNDLSYGLFDISIGKITRNASEFSDSLKTGMDHIHLDVDRAKVSFASPDISIEPGSTGKGYALRRVKEILKKHRVDSALVSFGESSILGIGCHPHGNYWPVAVSNPYAMQESLFTLKLQNSSMSTSGTLKGNDILNKTYHVYDPVYKNFVLKEMLVGVQTNDPFEAEGLSTIILLSENNGIDVNFDNFSPFIAHVAIKDGNKYSIKTIEN